MCTLRSICYVRIKIIRLDTAGIHITSEEIQHALKILKKAPGPDGVLTEMLVATGEYGLEELTRITNMMYNHGYFPEELNKYICITLPNISGTTKCEYIYFTNSVFKDF